MGFLPILQFARQLIRERVYPGDTVIDATLGNGNDALFLLGLVGREGALFGFDIQQAALDNTRARLEANAMGNFLNVRLMKADHADMAGFVPAERHGQVAAAMFNLGYLPGGEHDIVTRPDSTISALSSALALLRKGGIVTAVLYTGHPGGQDEADAVSRWASMLPQKAFQAVVYRFANQKNAPPYLIAVEKSG